MREILFRGKFGNEYFKWFTVIGNIYDSPELLKE